MKLTKEQLTVRAVKNRLCRIDDELALVFLDRTLPQKRREAIMNARLDIDGCVELLEKLLPSQSTLRKGN